ncbi:MAG TPA: hypothetical protein VFL96_14340 [Acidobacteriaceae bacterium]|nr:hypothetical protein [Acidobacteriaceae bacterium]
MNTPLTDTQRWGMFATFAYIAFRLELQRRYRKSNETNTVPGGSPHIVSQLSSTP